MDSELRTYEFQLSQVDTALEAEPDNEELKSLRAELANLIALTKEYQKDQDATQAKASAKAKESKHEYHAGDECMARHQADGRWYPAKITSVTGSSENPVYAILFTKYKTTEMVTGADLRPRQVHANATSTLDAASGQAPAYTKPKTAPARPMTNDERERERERKRVRKEKKMQREAEKNRVHDQKQSAWQKFQAKAVKKRYAGAQDKSMFTTSDNPYAKVGSSGRGMTQQAPRMRNAYEPSSTADD